MMYMKKCPYTGRDGVVDTSGHRPIYVRPVALDGPHARHVHANLPIAVSHRVRPIQVGPLDHLRALHHDQTPWPLASACAAERPNRHVVLDFLQIKVPFSEFRSLKTTLGCDFGAFVLRVAYLERNVFRRVRLNQSHFCRDRWSPKSALGRGSSEEADGHGRGRRELRFSSFIWSLGAK
jgi:hypothetical protein